MAPRKTRYALSLGLCAAALIAGAAPAAAADDPAALRGSEIAQARCSSCHAVALEAKSPVRDAPLFRVLSRLYPTERLHVKLLDLAENGHFEMPRVRLREDEAADVAAYIASLDGGAAEPRRRGRPLLGHPAGGVGSPITLR